MHDDLHKQMKKLALGTAQFGMDYGITNTTGQISSDDCQIIINDLTSNGIDMLDTAIGYGNSESIIGKANLSKIKVITKIPPISDEEVDAEAWCIQNVEESLKRLNIPNVYGLLLHKPTDILGKHGEKIKAAISHIIKSKMATKFGYSLYNTNDLELLIKAKMPQIVQYPCNILDRSLINSGWAKRLKANNVEIHIRSIFLQGLLLMSKKEQCRIFPGYEHKWEELEKWLNSANISALEACLSFANSYKEIDKAIVGVDSIKHFKKIIETKTFNNIQFPETLSCRDENLINPVNWKRNG